MKKYYKIPMTERVFKINGVSPIDILRYNYPHLYNREQGRMELQYSTNPIFMSPQQAQTIDEYNEVTNMMYNLQGIPKYIIAVSDGSDIKECATRVTIETFGYDCLLKEREVSKIHAHEYLNKTSNYIETMHNLLIPKEKKEYKKTILPIGVESTTDSKDN